MCTLNNMVVCIAATLDCQGQITGVRAKALVESMEAQGFNIVMDSRTVQPADMEELPTIASDGMNDSFREWWNEAVEYFGNIPNCMEFNAVVGNNSIAEAVFNWVSNLGCGFDTIYPMEVYGFQPSGDLNSDLDTLVSIVETIRDGIVSDDDWMMDDYDEDE